MSAAEALSLTRENGVCIGVSGANLILNADEEPAPAVVERHTNQKRSKIPSN